LEKTASILEQGGTFKVEIEKAAWNSHYRFGFQSNHENYIEVDGLQLAFVNTTTTFKPKFVLKFFICKARRMIFQMGNNVRPIKASDPQLAIVPYIVEVHEPAYTKWSMGGFLKSERMGSRHLPSYEPLIAQTFVGPPLNLVVMLKASEWPGKLDDVKELFSEAVKIAVDFSATDTRSTGP
jgi:hypothetical protein